jgi:TIR domain
MAHEVFISHSSLDKPVADAVCAALENIGIRCWIAPRDVQPGLSFAGEITRAIEHSKVMVLIFSAHSNTSAQILREVQLAANSHLHIVQFRIEDVVPNDDLEYYLSTPHWLDALTPPLEANLQRLGTSVKALLEMAAEEPAEGGMMPVAPLVDSRAERSRQDNVATVKDLTTPISAIAASKEPKASRRKRLITVTAGGAAMMLLFTITVLLMRPHPSVSKAAPPPVVEHATPNLVIEIAQRLIQFPFTPPDVKLKEKGALSSLNDWFTKHVRFIQFPFTPHDVKLKEKGALSSLNDWFTKHDKNNIDQLGSLDFYASSGPQSVGVVPTLHNTSAAVEIYRLPPTLSKETFEETEGPYRPGITKKYSNERSGEEIAKLKMGNMAQSELAYFYVSRLLGHLVEVPPVTYRTMDIQEFQKIAEQAKTTGHPSCTEAWAALRAMVNSANPKVVLSGGRLVYGSLALAENPPGEESPEDYWTLGSIRGHSFYAVLSSKLPVANTVNLNDAKCLQDLALAQDMTRGMILDSIFRQVDRLGNISIVELQHHVTNKGEVKWDDKMSDKDKSEAVSPFLPLKRIMYKNNDDGMMWGSNSISVSPILNDIHHLDQTIYNRLQWLAGLMQDSEPGSDAKIKDYFMNVVHITGDNYNQLRASLITHAKWLKIRVDSKDIQLDLDFEGTMEKLYAKEVEAAQQGGRKSRR